MEDKIYYGNYDDEGVYVGFYLEEIHGDRIPAQVIGLNEIQWKEALSGNYRVINGVHSYYEKTYEEINAIALDSTRDLRNALLLESDWTQLIDSPLSEQKKEEWRIYRKKLRDITDNLDFTKINFPEKPN